MTVRRDLRHAFGQAAQAIALTAFAAAPVVAMAFGLHCPKRDQAQLDIANVMTAARSFHARTGEWPRTLNVLVEAQLLERAPLDPWNAPYRYQLDGALPVVSTLGADRQHGGGDDLCSNDLERG